MTSKIITELKENNQDFEFYPTTKEMIKPIFESIRENGGGDILDIGCGTCNFKKFIDELNTEEQALEKRYRKLAEEKYEAENYSHFPEYYRAKEAYIRNYYVMEKSKILLNQLEKDVIVLGTDFHANLLIDKKVDVIFCNPPYSEYEEWTKKIIWESNCKSIYLIIPQRWKDNKEINKIIEDTSATVEVLGSFDFLNAERQARAKVDVLFINKQSQSSYGYNKELEDINERAFDKWFDDTFKMRNRNHEENSYEYEIENAQKSKIKSQLVNCESKAKMLIDLYKDEQKTLFDHFQAISSLDVDILETIGISKEGIKKALKQKIMSLKVLYWKIVFDEMDEITTRLTSDTREDMYNRFKSLLTVDFTMENIYALILWVIKNANQYYNQQLIDFFKKLSNPESIIKYKSNEKVFKRDEWRHSRFDDYQKVTHYVLDYRIVCDRFYFNSRYAWDKEINTCYAVSLLNDICTIAHNLGFEPVWISQGVAPKEFGKEYKLQMLGGNDGILLKYRVYKNGNVHFKFNKEFAKAINVEVSRLLGWIREKEDIAKEFPAEMAKGAEKYFKINSYIPLTGDGLKLLGTSNNIAVNNKEE